MVVRSDDAVLWSAVADLADGIADSAELDHVTGTLLPAVTAAVGAVVATVSLREDERTLRTLASTGMRVEVTAEWDEYDLAAAVPLAAAARTGEAQWLPDVAAARAEFPALTPGRSVSAAALPLLVDGAIVGVLGVGFETTRHFDESERAVLRAIAALVAAAVGRRTLPRPDRLRRHDHESAPGASIACLSRDSGARCTVARARPGARRGSTSVFATLLDADPELPSRTVERVSGVLGLCRRWRLPPARVGQAVAEIGEDLDGPITGAHVDIDTDTGWLAVAPLDASVIVATTATGQGTPTGPREGVLAGERLVLAGPDPAAVLVVTLDVRTRDRDAAAIREAAAGVAAHQPAGDAGAVLDRLQHVLRRDELLPCVRGALAAVLAARPDQRERVRSLPAQPVSATLGRRFAVAALPRDAGDEVASDVALVASELLSNAVRHAYDDVEVIVTDEADGTRIAVTDDDDRAPDAGPRDSTATSGRGMSIVTAVADEVGVTPRASGKAVWALLRWRRAT